MGHIPPYCLFSWSAVFHKWDCQKANREAPTIKQHPSSITDREKYIRMKFGDKFPAVLKKERKEFPLSKTETEGYMSGVEEYEPSENFSHFSQKEKVINNMVIRRKGIKIRGVAVTKLHKTSQGI